jgi:hypothetical protein
LKPVLELGSGRVHVRDHGADVTDDGGEDQNADQEVDGHKQVFNILKIGLKIKSINLLF